VVIIQSCVQVLRVIDSLQLTAKYSVATPVDWQNGDKVMVTPNLSDEQAKEKVSLYSAVSYVLALLHVMVSLRCNDLHVVTHVGDPLLVSMPAHVSMMQKIMTGARSVRPGMTVSGSLQFSKGFEKKDVPSGKGYIRLTPQPNA